MSNLSWMDVITAGYVEPLPVSASEVSEVDQLTERSRILCDRYGLEPTEENLAAARKHLIAFEKPEANVLVR